MYRLIGYVVGMSWCLAFCTPAGAVTIYVDAGATGANNGTSWTNAYTTLPTAITNASAGDEIWVAEGTYGAITLKTGVKIYGGFTATESSASQSDPRAHPTYLNKTGGTRPVTGIGNDTTTVLRGFHITGGSLDLTNYPNVGSGVYLKNSNALLVNCVFSGNTAQVVGAAAAIEGGSPTFVNCKFYGNDADWACGALHILPAAAPTFVNCLFYDNLAMQGGAVCSNLGVPTFINCTFVENQGTVRSAIYDYGGNAVFRNCIFWGNLAADPSMNPFENVRGTTMPTYSCVQDDDPNDENVRAGTGNIDDDPQFIYAAGDDFRIVENSLAANTANVLDLPLDVADLDWDGDTLEILPLDLDLVPRVAGTSLDMGAYEWHCGAGAYPPDTDPNLPDVGFGTANRYIPLVPLNTNMITALRVTLTNLPSPFTSFNGTTMWVAAPQETCENSSETTPPQGGCGPSGPGPLTFMGSRLTCDPVYMDWGAVGLIYVYDDEIVPGATYTVQAIYQGCDTADETQYSAPMSILTSQNWGDVTGDCSGSPCTPPDGIVDIVDVSAIQDKFVNIIDLPKARADLDPDVPNRVVNTWDILRASDATGGASYPFDGPADCPPPGGGGRDPPPGGE